MVSGVAVHVSVNHDFRGGVVNNDSPEDAESFLDQFGMKDEDNTHEGNDQISLHTLDPLPLYSEQDHPDESHHQEQEQRQEIDKE